MLAVHVWWADCFPGDEQEAKMLRSLPPRSLKAKIGLAPRSGVVVDVQSTDKFEVVIPFHEAGPGFGVIFPAPRRAGNYALRVLNPHQITLRSRDYLYTTRAHIRVEKDGRSCYLAFTLVYRDLFGEGELEIPKIGFIFSFHSPTVRVSDLSTSRDEDYDFSSHEPATPLCFKFRDMCEREVVVTLHPEIGRKNPVTWYYAVQMPKP